MAWEMLLSQLPNSCAKQKGSKATYVSADQATVTFSKSPQNHNKSDTPTEESLTRGVDSTHVQVMQRLRE